MKHLEDDIWFGGEAGCTLAQWRCRSGWMIRLVFCDVQVLRLRGGGKKRKKKTYTKPKKVKHVHKSVKLAVLKFYRVDDNGKVQRLRKSCPTEECGVGVHMAVHKDRFYCGKCGLTVSSQEAALRFQVRTLPHTHQLGSMLHQPR